MKYYSLDRESRSQLIIAIGIVGYIMVALLLVTAYRYEDMGHMNMTWSCLSIVTAYLMGYLLFQEHINNYTIMSIALALSAIYVGHLSDATASEEPININLDEHC
jgi:multidrug transporter EmrE-like cation transporter